MSLSLVLQKLSSFYASSEIFNIVLFMVSYILITGYSILLFMDPLNFFAVILKVFLVNLLAALNFANVFKNKKRLENKKTLKTGKKTFLHLCLAHGSLGTQKSASQQHLDRFIRFSTAHSCPTDTRRRTTPHL